MKRKFRILLAAFLILGAFFLFLIPRLSHIDRGWELSMRKGELQEWANLITEFENDTGQLPRSLYEASWYKDAGPVRLKVATGNLLVPDIQEMRDPNIFFNEVEYALLVYPKGWFVLELKPGKYWKHRLMIDHKGQFFELKKN